MIHQSNLQTTVSKSVALLTKLLKNASAGAWSSLMRMLALSSVLCCNIESVYPDQESLVGKILNCTIKPRYSEFKTRDTLAILWTSFRNAAGTLKPNHFVPLINSCTLNLQKCKTTKLEDTAGFPNIGKHIKLDGSYIKIFIRLFNFIHSLTLPPSYVVPTHITYFTF